MLTNRANDASPADLAMQVVADITARGLGPGDRYLTAAEAQLRFGVRKAVVDAAFRDLSERNILVRRQRAGTFVGPGSEAAAETQQLKKILVLYERQMPVYLKADELMRVLWQRFPGVIVQFILLQSRDEAKYVRSLIDDAAAACEKVGFIAISCSRSIYDVLASSRLPVVVLGSTDPQHEGRLASVDGDMGQAGRLLVQHLLERGQSRIAVIMNETWRVGDNHFYEGIRSAMSEAGMGIHDLRMISIPPDPASIRDCVTYCLAEDSPPTAFISQSGRLASGIWVPQVIADVLAEHGRVVPDDVSVVFHLDRHRDADPSPALPCTCRTWTWDKTFDHVAELLSNLVDDPEAARPRVRVPVTMPAMANRT